MRYAYVPRPGMTTLLTLVMLVSASCAEPESSTARLGYQAQAESPAALWLLPPKASSSASIFAKFEGRREADRFDFHAVRVHGEQWIVDEVERDGSKGLLAELEARRGTSIFAASADPYELADGTQVLRNAKTMAYVHRGVWAPPEASPAALARFGTTLEIVPLMDPHVVEVGGALPVRVRFRGPGLKGAELRAVHVSNESSERREWFRGVTGAVGDVDVPLSRSGLWMLSVEHPSPAEDALPRSLHLATFTFRVGEKG